MVSLTRRLTVLRKKLMSAYKDFVGGPYRLFSYLIEEPTTVAYGLNVLAASLGCRLQTVVQSQSRDLLKMIDRLINNCSKQVHKEIYYGKQNRKTHTQ